MIDFACTFKTGLKYESIKLIARYLNIRWGFGVCHAEIEVGFEEEPGFFGVAGG